VLRVVPRVERQEFVNVGVIVFCLEKRMLTAKVHVDEPRLRSLWPGLDLATVKQHTEAVVRICAGDETAGPIAKLSQRERFQWLIVTEDGPPVDRLFEQLVCSPPLDGRG
jgi:hypothetical protein